MAGSATSPGLRWIAPFAGMTMAEHTRDGGGHALVVFDDLSKHAATHREIALLTRQSPGREAYPDDVFYVQARLLERAAKLSKARGGGSLTALLIAETDAGNLSACIPTNLISITDGQIALDAKLFHQGQKPAVDMGTSVSRVGGKTQAAALRDAAKTVRLDYAQFLELEAFTRFAGPFSGRVLDAVRGDLGTSELFLVGTRGRTALAERGVEAGWHGAMPSHSPGIPKLADRIAQALYKRIVEGAIDRPDVVFSRWKSGHGIRVERRRLFPFDLAAFPHPKANDAPLLNLAPAALLRDLTADYMHAQLCKAALHAFAAENEARMEAMAAARSGIARQLSSLQAKQRQVRQEEITAEIIELAAGVTASRPGA